MGAWESLAPGLTAHQLALREAGKSVFSLDPELKGSGPRDGFVGPAVRVDLWQRVLLVTRREVDSRTSTSQ